MSRNLVVAAALAALTVVGLSAPVQVQAQSLDIPALCDTPSERGLFALGIRKGRNLARQALTQVTDCFDDTGLALVRATVIDITERITVPPDASDAVQCHVLGQIAGLVDEVIQFQEDCVDACIIDGQTIGEIAALLYCELSKALDGLGLADLFTRLATGTCGTNFETSCDAKFVSSALADPECVEFTEAPFDEVFDVTLNNQCAFDPDD